MDSQIQNLQNRVKVLQDKFQHNQSFMDALIAVERMLLDMKDNLRGLEDEIGAAEQAISKLEKTNGS